MSLTLVHVTGTGYIDYFTNGRVTVTYPGDPAIDGNLNTPNAPLPTRPGLTWIGARSFPLYDTPSGTLEVGDYAQTADGSYDVHIATSTYADTTSSVTVRDHVISTMTNLDNQ